MFPFIPGTSISNIFTYRGAAFAAVLIINEIANITNLTNITNLIEYNGLKTFSNFLNRNQLSD